MPAASNVFPRASRQTGAGTRIFGSFGTEVAPGKMRPDSDGEGWNFEAATWLRIGARDSDNAGQWH